MDVSVTQGFEGLGVDRTPAGFAGEARRLGQRPRPLWWDHIGDGGKKSIIRRHNGTRRRVQGENGTSEIRGHPFDHLAEMLVPGFQHHVHHRERLIGIENENFRAGFSPHQVGGDQRSPFIGCRRAAVGAPRHRYDDEAPILHRLELPAQDYPLVRRRAVIGMGQDFFRCRIVAFDRVVDQIGVRRDDQSVVAEKSSAQ